MQSADRDSHMAESIQDKIALHIAKRMTAVRLQKTWTRDELAHRSKVNVHTLKRFERTGQISLPRLVALCKALDMLEDLTRAFKSRQRVNVDDWQVRKGQTRQRGRRRETEP